MDQLTRTGKTPRKTTRLATGLSSALLMATLWNSTTLAAEPAVSDSISVKIVGSFEEGVDKPWSPPLGQYAPHYWTTYEPVYSAGYDPADVPSGIAWWKEINFAWDPAQPDNVNWWHTLGSKTGAFGYTDTEYKLNIDGLTNSDDWSAYTSLELKWFAGRSNHTNCNIQVFVRTEATGRWVDLGSIISSDGQVRSDSLSLSPLTSAEKGQVSRVMFRVFNNGLPAGNDYNNWQRTHIYSVKLKTASPPSVTASTAPDQPYTHYSKFLGSVLHRRYGSYSPSGFWDDSAGKYKIWFGGGIPEAGSSDNVWYVESSSLAPGADLATPTRITLNGASGILKPYNQAPGYGGDPSVIRVGSTYLMYFSGLSVSNGWNQIYRATSQDGVNWTLNPQTPIVAADSGGVSGYGSGGPSVVYKDGTYYLYYYSQSETECETEDENQCETDPTRGTVYRKSSTDPASFTGQAVAMTIQGNAYDISAMDVKYSDSLGKWIAATETTHPDGSISVVGGVSDDGLDWTPVDLAQNPASFRNHNAGIIGGNESGHVASDVYVSYGVSEVAYGETEYYTRQLGYSSWRIR